MISDHSTFKYQGQTLIEKFLIDRPDQYDALFQDRGCFIYFKGKGPKLLSSESNVQVESRGAVLLRCGAHFLNLLKDGEDEVMEIVAIHLYPEVLKKLYIGELPDIIEKRSTGQRSQAVAPNDLISRFIDSLEFYFENPTLVNDDLLELKIKELVLLLVQSQNVNSILELVADLYTPKKVQLRDVIELHLYSNLKLEQLAGMCNLSLSSFKREFKKEFNDSPTNYIIHKKLEKAQELLRLTDIPINEVAYEVGFHDPLYFTRLFKKKMQMAPSNYRVEHSV